MVKSETSILDFKDLSLPLPLSPPAGLAPKASLKPASSLSDQVVFQ